MTLIMILVMISLQKTNKKKYEYTLPTNLANLALKVKK